MRTAVAIIGAGPAGLLLGRLLSRRGIDNVILEARDQAYLEARIRAGVLEQGTVDLLAEAGVDARLRREGLVHHGIELRWEGRSHRVPMSELTGGRTVTVYGQTEVVKDLLAARQSDGAPLLWQVSDVRIERVETTSPVVRFIQDGQEQTLECDVVAGCDGFHGVSRPTIPAARGTVFQRGYPFAWLGILARVPPSCDELIYARHRRGFAMHSMRSSEVSRLYLQVSPGDHVDNWSDGRIWDELQTRLALDGWSLEEGPIIDRSITPMRSFVSTPMRHGRLFLAGDAAHIVPPTGAKGLNLAVSDVSLLFEALSSFFHSRSETLLDRYSDEALRRVWRAEHFSWWMTSMLHVFPDASPFDEQIQLAQLEYVASSRAAATSLAENYTGLRHISTDAAGRGPAVAAGPEGG
jgi:p-hydroxybenzoate 3-monooxygenase